MATLYKTTGEKVTISPKDGRRFSLEELQLYVGGYVELIRIGRDNYLVVDEEGTLKGLPLNPGATKIVRQLGYTHIVGDAVYCKEVEL